MTDDKPHRGRGRPTRVEASPKALAALAAAGIDPASVDPRVVLAAIAADPSAPASARVSAAGALLTDQIDRELARPITRPPTSGAGYSPRSAWGSAAHKTTYAPPRRRPSARARFPDRRSARPRQAC
jgi:hypothetical protein